MNLERLKILEEFARQDPDDPFNSYALALEYRTAQPARAAALFDNLLFHHPTYVPTYYHAGNFFWEAGEFEKAIGIVTAGIAHARKANDRKAANELQTLLESME